VIYPNPGFPIYESQILACGAKPVPVHLKEERDFRLRPGGTGEAAHAEGQNF
jgi:aspartate/methionine/tyrosine aminotransferase